MISQKPSCLVLFPPKAKQAPGNSCNTSQETSCYSRGCSHPPGPYDAGTSATMAPYNEIDPKAWRNVEHVEHVERAKLRMIWGQITMVGTCWKSSYTTIMFHISRLWRGLFRYIPSFLPGSWGVQDVQPLARSGCFSTSTKHKSQRNHSEEPRKFSRVICSIQSMCNINIRIYMYVYRYSINVKYSYVCAYMPHSTAQNTTQTTMRLHLHQSHHLANKYIRLHQIAVNYMTNHTNPYKSCISVYLSANMYTQIHTNHTSFKQGKSQFRWCHQFHILHVISFWVLRPGSNLSGITLTLKETTNKTESIESFWVYLQHIFLYIIIYVHVFFLWFFV